jgi:LmbE family N-acetylglucosaminyl deacetylase
MKDNIQSKVVIIAPHPDDEWIGCGCLIQKQLDENKEVLILLITEIEESAFRAIASKQIANSHGAQFKNLKEKERAINEKRLVKFFKDNIEAKDSVFIPTADTHSDHCTINSIAKKTLKNRNLYEYCIYNNTSNHLKRAYNKILRTLTGISHQSFISKGPVQKLEYKLKIKNEYIAEMFGETPRSADIFRKITKKKKHLEFYGLSGTGKSTTVNNLLKINQNKSPFSKFKSQPIPKTQLIKIIFSNLNIFLLFLKYYLKCFPRTIIHTKEFFGPLYNHYLLFSNYLKTKHNIQLIEHGFLQTLVQSKILRETLAKENDFLLKILKLIPRDPEYKYIYLKISIEKALERGEKRGDFKSQSEYKEALEIFEIISSTINSFVINSEEKNNKVINKVIKLSK